MPGLRLAHGGNRMSGSRLALVADDARLASAIGSHLEKALGQTAFVCKFESIRDLLGPDTDGVLVLAASSPADAKEILRLVQEISLQHFPPTILVLAGEAATSANELTSLQSHICRQIQWPQQAAMLVTLVKERMGRGQAFTDIGEKSLEEVIGRRLLCWTPSLMPMVDRLCPAAALGVTVRFASST